MNRRKFIQTAGALAVATAAAPLPALHAAEKSTVTARHLPRWRGFNLLQKFVKKERGNPPFPESDFALVSEWGFDFTRLPLSYLCWTDPNDWLKLREEDQKHLDDAVPSGGKHGSPVISTCTARRATASTRRKSRWNCGRMTKRWPPAPFTGGTSPNASRASRTIA